MKEFIKDNLSFIFICSFIVMVIILFCLFPPEGSLLKSLGNLLGQIFGDIIEGFKEGMDKIK